MTTKQYIIQRRNIVNSVRKYALRHGIAPTGNIWTVLDRCVAARPFKERPMLRKVESVLEIVEGAILQD